MALPWQQAQWQQLTTNFAHGRLAHALLLAGPRGVGKGHFARTFAAFMLCEAQGSQVAAKPCGQCRSCIQVESGVHPNLLLLTPQEEKREIAIDDVRALIERLHLTSHYGQVKVAIITPAESLNTSSVNALLKIIEEPPAATHLLLVAERWRALPATLRSRCQLLRFAPPAAGEGLTWLKSHYPQQSHDTLQPLARSPMLALTALEPEVVEARAEWGRALAELVRIQAGSLPSLKLAQGIKREAAQFGLECWLQTGAAWLKQLLAPAASSARLPEGLQAATISQLLADVLAGLRGLERNGNPALIVESIMIRTSRAVRNPS